MIIDITSFTSGPRQIENASATETPNANQLAVSKAIKGYIEYYEPIYLSEMLGSTLGEQVETYSQSEHEEPDESMESLIAMLKESCADYVFFHMLRDMNEQSTITGRVRLQCANTYVSVMDKGVRIWNDMVRRNQSLKAKIADLGYDATVDSNMLSSINNLNL